MNPYNDTKHFYHTDKKLYVMVKLLIERGYSNPEVHYYPLSDQVRQGWWFNSLQSGWVLAGRKKPEAIEFIKNMVKAWPNKKFEIKHFKDGTN